MLGCTVYSEAGGVGKTTMAANLAKAEVCANRDVLVADLDTQEASLSYLLDVADARSDETDGTLRASQSVTVSDAIRTTPLASEQAALNIGANNLVAYTTTTGEQYLYEDRSLFDRFCETTRDIARL